MFEKRKNKIESLYHRAAAMDFFGEGQQNIARGSGQCWGAQVAEGLKASLDMSPDERRENDKALGQLFERAHAGDVQSRHELHALVIEQTQNFIAAESEWVRFFEVRNLEENESPAFVNLTKMEVKAKYIGQDTGKPESTKVVRPRGEVKIDLYELATETVEYKTRDIYTGDVTEAARAMFDLSRDLAQQIEAILEPVGSGLLATSLGSFDLTNANKARRTYVPARRIRSGVLPTANTLSISGIGAGTKFGFHVIDEVVDYCVRIGDADGTGALMPTGEIIVPADEIRHIASGMAATNAAQNDIAQQTLRRGWLDLGDYMGVKNIRIIPSRTLPIKYCYPRLNKPVGLLWFKPSEDVVDEQVDRIKKIATRAEMKVIGSAIPEPNRKNFIQVRYTT